MNEIIIYTRAGHVHDGIIPNEYHTMLKWHLTKDELLDCPDKYKKKRWIALIDKDEKPLFINMKDIESVKFIGAD